MSVSPTSAALIDPADAALGAGRYKEAIEHFKELLKRERRPAWLDGLAAAYAGRAGQLAAKGMVKEALALWRTRSQTCNVALLDGPYVAWLMKTGQTELALGLLPAVDKLAPELRDGARAQLAPALLLAPDHLLTGLDAESLRHRATARTALAACAQGDEAGLEPALQAISFRSPYRDLRPLLKALALRASAPQMAAAALAHVPEKGPFEALARALRVCLMPGSEWLAGLRQLDDAGRTLVLDLKGCPASQRPLVLDLMARAGETAPTPLDLFDLLQRHRRALPDGVARPLCLRLLPHAAQRLDAWRASFPSATAAEQEHVLALAAELKQRPDQAEAHWLRLVKLLDKPGHAPAEQRRVALVLRRLADEHSHHSPDGSLCVHAQDWLAQSLRFEPADRDTHLRLLRDARLGGDLKLARSRLDAAQQRLPEDPVLLQEAVEIALAAGAFKKAAGLAKQVLQADPLNPRVRTLIGQAHLAHARKQIGAHNLQAARRELDEAATWLRSADERGLVELLRGFAAEPAADGDALLRQAVADLGGPLVGGLHLLLEGKRVKSQPALAPKDLLRRAGVDSAATPDASQVVALAQALHAVAQRDVALGPALNALSGMLERAATSVRFSESDHLLVCEALHRHALPELTRRFAAAALEHWPQRPVFVYLEVAARFGAAPWRMPQREWQRLDKAFKQAREQGDQRTAARLSKLLDESGDEPPGANGAPDLDELGTDGIDDMMDMLLTLGGEDRFLELARQELGPATFDQLRRTIKGSKKQFALALIELLAASRSRPSPPVRILPPQAKAPKVPKAPKTSSPSAPGKIQSDLFDD